MNLNELRLGRLSAIEGLRSRNLLSAARDAHLIHSNMVDSAITPL